MPADRALFDNAVREAKKLVAKVVRPGNICLDATCGNGQDTAFLAQLVGVDGRVYAFDVQKVALEQTQSRLNSKNLANRVTLIHDGHHQLMKHISDQLSCAMFNLGYLPGGNKEITTQPETTIQALEQATKLLRPWGLISMVIYTGHPGGEEEAASVEGWISGLDQNQWVVVRLTYPNRQHHPPYLLAVQKRGG